MKGFIYTGLCSFLIFSTSGAQEVVTASGSESPSGYTPNIQVVIDKTRDRQYSAGAQTAKVYIDGVLKREFPISTGREIMEIPKNGPAYCSITPTGDFRLQYINADHKSREWGGVPMPYAMFWDTSRGLALHSGDVNSQSGGCVRLPNEHARWLYGEVEKMGRSNLSAVSVRILDHSPQSVQDQVRRDCENKIAARRNQPPTPANRNLPVITPQQAQQMQQQQVQQPQRRRTLMDLFFSN